MHQRKGDNRVSMTLVRCHIGRMGGRMEISRPRQTNGKHRLAGRLVPPILTGLPRDKVQVTFTPVLR